MIWPGMGDPAKRKKTLKFLLITGIIAVSVGVASSLIQGQLAQNDPLKSCINDKDTRYLISASLELYVDGARADIPARVGFEEGGCQRSMYTLDSSGTIYAEWTEEYPFEIGHFLWMWEFPIRDMEQSKSRIIVDGSETPQFIGHELVDGAEYRAEFVSKARDSSKDSDFLPPDL